jgi:hypothetical protein
MLISVLNLLLLIGMWRFLFEGGAYVFAKNFAWATRITIKHNKVIDLVLRHKLKMTAWIADRIDTNNTYRLLSRASVRNIFIQI